MARVPAPGHGNCGDCGGGTVNETVLSVQDLKVHFKVPRGGYPWSSKATLRAVEGVSFQIRRGETLGLVGESGCGKSTLARAIIGLTPVTDGSVRWHDTETVRDGHRPADAMQRLRKDVQMVFQDPLASLDPRMTIEQIVAEPLKVQRKELGREETRVRVLTMLERVGLGAHHLARYAHEFSGGQCQRIGIARALVAEPQLVICDEPVSALDVSIQAQIVNLLRDLQRELSLSLLFVAHDLAVVKAISHRVLVMYLGRVMELGTRREVYGSPQHPYTRALLSSVPRPDPATERTRKHAVLSGEMPSPLNLPSGCAFRTRCPDAIAACAGDVPQAVPRGTDDRRVACIRVGEQLEQASSVIA
ncbi:ABC transporter ATP-binding protein [Paraburkholderia sp. DHOC27]|uniref:ABC transporter ATP-binding protein n=1 Tax=Paraburkholderia sp. DHOC27 TaxID=2303330 RepID=UPI000E3EDAC2|nr:oligopeptide/dipeptide ABC transporter ATP-binding protein [Paraburkholderia sp. DHOC27]RFU47057.1 ATP-binding cassette domain-containing protein [Paraburkholderia sp. DHOC27]